MKNLAIVRFYVQSCITLATVFVYIFEILTTNGAQPTGLVSSESFCG